MELDWDLNQVYPVKGIVKVQVFNLILILFFLDQVWDGVAYIGKKFGKIIMSLFR
jgi:hypothetical protein